MRREGKRQDRLVLLLGGARSGIKARDCTSFGLPHTLRLSAQPPPAQGALIAALDRFMHR